MNFMRRIPFYPIAFGFFPALSLWGHNATEVDPIDVVQSLVVLTLSALILLVFFRLVMRDWHRVSSASTLVLLVFLSYGHFYRFNRALELPAAALGRHRYLLPFLIVMIGIRCYWIG